MRLWKMEFYKITARPVMLIGLLLIVGFLALIIFQEAMIAHTEIDGKTYDGLEAIQADRELAKEYEGVFTAEKAEEIVKQFGFSAYLEDPEISVRREGNYCSQFVTDTLTDFRQTEEKPADFIERKDWKNPYGEYCISGHLRFGYTAGWQCLHEIWKQAIIYLNIWLMLMVAPIFSEEYSRKTVPILLSTEHGKAKGIRKKITAALSLGILCYVPIMALLFAMVAALFGWDGLNASASMLLEPSYWQSFPESWNVSHYLLLLFFRSMASMLLNICIMLFLSSKCQRTVSAVTAGVVLFLLPYLINAPLFSMLLDTRVARHYIGWLLMYGIRIFSISMPLYLPVLEDMMIPVRFWKPIPFIVLTVAVLGIWRAYVNYKNCH